MKQFDVYRDLLLRWAGTLNLSSAATSNSTGFDTSIADSLQLLPHLPIGLSKLVDLGSGQGFPAIPVAIATGIAIELIESDRRKAAFLMTAMATLSLQGRVWSCRIEQAAALPAQCVTARALAPLAGLLDLAARFVEEGGCCLFLKGPNVDVEIQAARRTRKFTYAVHPTASPRSNVVKLTHLR